jgi:RNA polymerase sigma-70 factor (ECF subfamily)
MADADADWRLWVQRLAEGDEQVVGEFWRDYGGRLQALAAGFLTSRLQRREGPEDVVQSVCRTFLRRSRAGEFQLADRDALWRLLCAITLAKVREKARFHGRQKRRLDRERHLDSSRVGGKLVPAKEPTPAEAAEFADQMQQLLFGMDEEERQIVTMRLEQFTYAEMAERLGCSERTVRRMVKRVQERLKGMLEDSGRQ